MKLFNGYKDIEKLRATRKKAQARYQRSPKGKITHYGNNKAWMQRNHHKVAVYQKVLKAKKNGKLVAEPCLICGASNAQAHHPDYSKPLEVIWLCACHHIEHHMKEREG